jgi:uncharacterized protein (TIGR00251 family)
MTVEIYVQPGAKRSETAGEFDGKPKIRIKAPPVDGAANKEVIRFVAKSLNISKSSVRLVKGELSRHKTLEIDSDEELIKDFFGGLS